MPGNNVIVPGGHIPQFKVPGGVRPGVPAVGRNYNYARHIGMQMATYKYYSGFGKSDISAIALRIIAQIEHPGLR
jgi:hypothetical protein